MLSINVKIGYGFIAGSLNYLNLAEFLILPPLMKKIVAGCFGFILFLLLANSTATAQQIIPLQAGQTNQHPRVIGSGR